MPLELLSNSNSLSIAKAVAREACIHSEVTVVLDLGTPYLPEAWVPMDLAEAIIEEVSRCSHVSIVLGTFVGNPMDAMNRLPKSVSKRVAEPSSYPKCWAWVKSYRKWLRVEVLELGTVLAISIPRTNPYPPILGSVAILATYSTNPQHRWALYSDPRWIDFNISSAYIASAKRAVAVTYLGKAIACDGPIHGCLDSLSNVAIVGEPPEVDRALSIATGIELRYLRILESSSYLLPNPIPISSSLKAKRVKTHSLSSKLSKAGLGKRR